MATFRMFPLRVNSVIQLYELKDQINLDPSYQRLSVWKKSNKQRFIDSVINGFDIPKLYFHEVPSSSDSSDSFRYAVIDGKQRLLSLWDFMSNHMPLAEDFVFFEDETIQAAGATYDELMASFPRLRARFDSFDVPITIVQTDDENFIDSMFDRLNIQVPLSAAERRNALGGPLPFYIRRVGISEFFTDFMKVRNDRLQHFDLAAKFLYLTWADAIESTKRMTLDNFVTAFRRLRENKKPEASDERIKKLEGKTKEILSSMRDFFEPQDSLLGSQGRVTLYYHLFRIHAKLKQPIRFERKMLAQFNDEVTAARKKSQRRAAGSQEELTDREQNLVFFDREKQSPNDAGAIKRQYGYFIKYFQTVFKVKLPEPD